MAADVAVETELRSRLERAIEAARALDAEPPSAATIAAAAELLDQVGQRLPRASATTYVGVVPDGTIEVIITFPQLSYTCFVDGGHSEYEVLILDPRTGEIEECLRPRSDLLRGLLDIAA